MSIREDMLAMMLDGGGGNLDTLYAHANGLYKAEDYKVTGWDKVFVNVAPYVDANGTIIVPFNTPKETEGLEYATYVPRGFRIGDSIMFPTEGRKALRWSAHTKNPYFEEDTEEDYAPVVPTQMFDVSGGIAVYHTNDINDENVLDFAEKTIKTDKMQYLLDNGCYLGVVMCDLIYYNKDRTAHVRHKSTGVWLEKQIWSIITQQGIVFRDEYIPD